MLITAAYPATFESNAADGTGLSITLDAIEDLVPASSGLHVLPFGPSAGDSGFACNDWFACDSELANWHDIERAGRGYRLIVDGIYNHVGARHTWVRNLERSNALVGLEHFHTRSAAPSTTGPHGPRGQRQFQPCPGAEGRLEIAQTFSKDAYDINLDDPSVLKEVDRHLALCREHGVYGIRLDAAAYYGKDPHGPVRHNRESVRLLGTMVSRVEEHGLHPYPQLDVDEQTKIYQPALKGSGSVLVDLAFPAVLCAALDAEDPHLVIDHVIHTGERGWTALRGFRTHDGFLLRSESIGSQHLAILQRLVTRSELDFRVVDGTIYELTASAPRIYREIFPPDPVRLLRLAAAMCAFGSSNPGIYLPALVGFEPECSASAIAVQDPRLINRLPIPMSFWTSPSTRRVREQARTLLGLLARVSERWDVERGPPTMTVTGTRLESTVGGHRLVANISRRPISNPILDVSGVKYSSGDATRSELGPYSFVITRTIRSTSKE